MVAYHVVITAAWSGLGTLVTCMLFGDFPFSTFHLRMKTTFPFMLTSSSLNSGTPPDWAF